MICQNCKQAEASVHLTKVINNVKTEVHLCQQCAIKSGELKVFSGPQSMFSNFLTGLFQNQNPFIQLERGSNEACPVCGCQYKEFAATSFLGCAECYKAFEERLKPVVSQIHGHASHVGKIPKRAGKVYRERQELENMKRELQKLINTEEYEQAALVRDKIKNFEKNMTDKEGCQDEC